MTNRIDPETRARLFEAICADSETRDLLIRGTKYGTLGNEPVYEPDKSYVSKEVDAARTKAEVLSKSIAPEVDPSLPDFGMLFLEARLELTKHMKR